jgi:hypothetical protein
VQSTARTDNPGSWKSVTKAAEGLGLDIQLDDINTNPNYGPALRYQLSLKLKP